MYTGRDSCFETSETGEVMSVSAWVFGCKTNLVNSFICGTTYNIWLLPPILCLIVAIFVFQKNVIFKFHVFVIFCIQTTNVITVHIQLKFNTKQTKSVNSLPLDSYISTSFRKLIKFSFHISYPLLGPLVGDLLPVSVSSVLNVRQA